jgi:hypothetical protein
MVGWVQRRDVVRREGNIRKQATSANGPATDGIDDEKPLGLNPNGWEMMGAFG